MSDIIEQSIYDIVKSGYGKYQAFVNGGKFLPEIDGLKAVQRRYLLSVREEGYSKFVKSTMVLGSAMYKYHPHESQPDTLYSMVRNGLVIGQGNFGMTSAYKTLPGAAERYTEVKYNKSLDNLLFKFENYFIKSENDLGNLEPNFLITPVPIALLRGCIGIGCGGARTKIPAFTYESLMDAYANNNPNLLKSSYGLEIDYESSTLNNLWTKGHGKVVLKFECKKLSDGSVELSGDATVAKPDLSKLIKWESDGLITIVDSTTDKMKLNFSRNSNIRKITDKDIYNEVQRVSTIDGIKATYVIMFSHKGSVVKMGIKGWLDLTLNIYKTTFQKWQSLEIAKHNRQIDKLKMIPAVADLIRAGKTTAQIASELSRTRKFIASIEALPLSMLRKSDFTANINKLEVLIKSIEDTKVDDLINSGKIIDGMINVI